MLCVCDCKINESLHKHTDRPESKTTARAEINNVVCVLTFISSSICFSCAILFLISKYSPEIAANPALI